MNIEIKFRAKCRTTGEWLIGDLITLHGSPSSIWRGGNVANSRLIDPKTIGMFTGFLDKKGKEIYGGDILRQWLPESPEINKKGGFWWYAEVVMLDGAWRVVEVNFTGYDGTYHPELLFEEAKRGNPFEIYGNAHDIPTEKLNKLNF